MAPAILAQVNRSTPHTSMDTIFISELHIDTRIGIYEREKQVAQTIQLDLEIGLCGEHATHSDRIEDTIDYAEVVADIRKLFAEQHFALLEHAAESIAQLVMQHFKAPWLRITIAKLSPFAGVKRLGVCIERGKRS
jgi:dihydroneopterin aldolase